MLGLITASITLELALTYEFETGKMVGRASVTVEVEVLFFSTSVEISCERRLAGSNGDPTFARGPRDRGRTGRFPTRAHRTAASQPGPSTSRRSGRPEEDDDGNGVLPGHGTAALGRSRRRVPRLVVRHPPADARPRVRCRQATSRTSSTGPSGSPAPRSSSWAVPRLVPPSTSRSRHCSTSSNRSSGRECSPPISRCGRGRRRSRPSCRGRPSPPTGCSSTAC